MSVGVWVVAEVLGVIEVAASVAEEVAEDVVTLVVDAAIEEAMAADEATSGVVVVEGSEAIEEAATTTTRTTEAVETKVDVAARISLTVAGNQSSSKIANRTTRGTSTKRDGPQPRRRQPANSKIAASLIPSRTVASLSKPNPSNRQPAVVGRTRIANNGNAKRGNGNASNSSSSHSSRSSLNSLKNSNSNSNMLLRHLLDHQMLTLMQTTAAQVGQCLSPVPHSQRSPMLPHLRPHRQQQRRPTTTSHRTLPNLKRQRQRQLQPSHPSRTKRPI